MIMEILNGMTMVTLALVNVGLWVAIILVLRKLWRDD